MTKRFTHILSICCFVLGALLPGCGNDTEKVPDTTGVQLKLETSRFDKDLYAIDSAHIGEGLKQLATKYPDFLDYFLDTIMAYEIRGNYQDTAVGIREGLKPFLVYKDFKELEDTIMKHYPDTRATDEQLQGAFKLMKHYFPEYHVPRIIYLNMGLSNWPSFPVDSNTFCIGLDMFLGDAFPHYRAIGIPYYMLSHHREQYIPVSVFSSIYWAKHPFVSNDKNLLELMIQRGKAMYFLHKMLPNMPDSVLFGYKQVQVDWCNKNEAFIYNFFIQQKLLYNTRAHDVMPYVTDGPFAQGLEASSVPDKVTPGSVGTWLGYKIVASYMQQNPTITLRDLLAQPTDPVVFLEKARYKPR